MSLLTPRRRLTTAAPRSNMQVMRGAVRTWRAFAEERGRIEALLAQPWFAEAARE